MTYWKADEMCVISNVFFGKECLCFCGLQKTVFGW